MTQLLASDLDTLDDRTYQQNSVDISGHSEFQGNSQLESLVQSFNARPLRYTKHSW